jgi:ribosomal protein L37E
MPYKDKEKRLIHDRQLRANRLSQNLCSRCGKHIVITGEKLCIYCSEKLRIRALRYIPAHRDEIKKQKRENRKRDKLLRICIDCGANLFEGESIRCVACTIRKNEAKNSYHIKGVLNYATAD